MSSLQTHEIPAGLLEKHPQLESLNNYLAMEQLIEPQDRNTNTYNADISHFTCLECERMVVEPLQCKVCEELICAKCTPNLAE